MEETGKKCIPSCEGKTQLSINVFSAPASQTKNMKLVKIGLSLFIVFIVSFTPGLYVVNFGGTISGYLRFTIMFNNVANFFVYLVVDEEFRAKLKAMCKRSRE